MAPVASHAASTFCFVFWPRERSRLSRSSRPLPLSPLAQTVVANLAVSRRRNSAPRQLLSPKRLACSFQEGAIGRVVILGILIFIFAEVQLLGSPTATITEAWPTRRRTRKDCRAIVQFLLRWFAQLAHIPLRIPALSGIGGTEREGRCWDRTGTPSFRFGALEKLAALSPLCRKRLLRAPDFPSVLRPADATVMQRIVYSSPCWRIRLTMFASSGHCGQAQICMPSIVIVGRSMFLAAIAFSTCAASR
jgi:hypothetical protein